MSSSKRLTGPLFPIIVFAATALIILSLSRLGLTIWEADRITESSDYLHIFLQGIRIDFATVCWLYALPALLSCLLPFNGLIGRFWKVILRIWLVVGLWILVYMELATPAFISEYDLRPNRLFIEYLIYPKEVLSMLWGGYKLELLIGFVGTITTLFLGWKLSAYTVKNIQRPKWYWMPIMFLLVALVSLLGARSTLEHRPLNPSLVAFSTTPLLNDLVLNSTYSVIFALKNMTSEKNVQAFYGKMDRQEIIDRVRASTAPKDAFISEEIPTLRVNKPSYTGKPKNLVILLQESLGARFVGAYGGLNLTPNLDKLIDESWMFSHLYATGTRSVRGIEAVVSGFSPTPSRSVVKLSKSQTNFFTIAQLLQRHNYHTQFIYGGESHFDNMKSFFLGNGFTDIFDFPRFKNPEFTGSWGASDGDLYNAAHQQFVELNSSGQPFFSLVFTSSNHTPFEYPEGKIDPEPGERQTRNNAIKYSDYALGELIKKAKQADYWKDTIFLLIADHDATAYGDVPVPVKNFHIPAVIFGGGIKAQKDDRLASNIDMPPTLLSLIGVENRSPMLGQDLSKPLDKAQQRIMLQFDKNFAYFTPEKLVVLQPQKAAIAYQYNFTNKTLSPTTLTESESKQALAHVLWGDLAYQEQLYRLESQ
jgi:phosphoglycerol transferase MdoB-like AlkP superfamily enzyme